MNHSFRPFSRPLFRPLLIIATLLLLFSFQFQSLPFEPVATSLAATTVVLPDTIADRVLGQPAFNFNTTGLDSSSFNGPAGLAIAPAGAPGAGRLFITDYNNNRILSGL